GREPVLRSWYRAAGCPLSARVRLQQSRGLCQPTWRRAGRSVHNGPGPGPGAGAGQPVAVRCWHELDRLLLSAELEVRRPVRGQGVRRAGGGSGDPRGLSYAVWPNGSIPQRQSCRASGHSETAGLLPGILRTDAYNKRSRLPDVTDTDSLGSKQMLRLIQIVF